MLIWRLILGPLIILAALGIFTLDYQIGESAPLFLVVCLALCLRSVWELHQLFKTRAFETVFWLPALCTGLIIAANWIPHWSTTVAQKLDPLGNLGPAFLALAISVTLLFLHATSKYRAPGHTIETLGAEILMICYVGVLASLTLQLRWVQGPDRGYIPFASLIVVTKAGDISAFFIGRMFGRSKLIPLVSPGKTWAGFRGAVVGSVLASVLFFHAIVPLFVHDAYVPRLWVSMLYGLLVGLAGMMGDLCESLIKRDVGQKDSSHLLPGFGGLLDLMDSIFFPGPLAYLLWLWLPMH